MSGKRKKSTLSQSSVSGSDMSDSGELSSKRHPYYIYTTQYTYMYKNPTTNDIPNTCRSPVGNPGNQEAQAVK